ncbi:hypothetical protein [Kitasatospora sp. GP82]|uniref:hypothetical protein n=1 Tax=Kitasatospora sp. GP82 TaxID=3035089 RepID=UPI0024755A80|nr:hypothetical protein [Kitasatospora sp. GP82]MDH6124321.1 hypothetical protein [Kitasatospora sp. GP82]
MALVRRAVTAALAACLLAGCGSGAGGAGSSPGTSADSPSALATPTDRSPHGVLLSAQLQMDTARRAKFGYRLDGEGASGMLFWAPKTVLVLNRFGTAQQLIVLDTTAYLGGDQPTAARLGGRHWQKFTTVPGPDGQREVPYSALVDRLNPMVALTAAVAASDPQLVGEEKRTEGVVQHYRVTVSADAYVAAQTQLSAARRAALRNALGKVALVTLDFWLNDKDQLVELHRAGQGPSVKLDDTVQYTELGGPLSVQAPAEGDTVDAGKQSLPPLTP